jgi:hypothetical protein
VLSSYLFSDSMESMIQENSASAGLECVCPECKNIVSLSRYPNLVVGMVIECDHCGMTLLVKEIANATVKTEIVDEGK